MAKAAAVFLWVMVCFASADEQRDAGKERLVLLDGTAVTGSITRIDSAGNVTVQGFDKPIKLDGLRRIERSVEKPVDPSNNSDAKKRDALKVVDLVGGGRLFAESVTIADEQCRIGWPFGEPFSLPIDAVRAIRLQAGTNDDELRKAATARREEFDQLFVTVDGKLAPIKGFIERLDQDTVVFEWKDEQRTISRAKLFGIVVAMIGRPPDRTGHCLVELKGGSSIWGRLASVDLNKAGADAPGKLTLQVAEKTKIAFPWNAVTRVNVRSGRLVYLSDLMPADAIEQPIVAFPKPWQRDKSIGGRTLRLAGRTFQKGIGVQSRSLLTFNTDEKYAHFAATVGIDAETSGRGDCLFIVLGDGKQLFKRRMKGKDVPFDVRVDVRGMQQVTLLVEPGEDLDLSDHADWCDACFIRVRK